MEAKEAALAAWKNPKGQWHEVGGFHVRHDEKMAEVRCKQERPEWRGPEITVHIFPKPALVGKLLSTVRSVDGNNPVTEAPGAAGTASAVDLPEELMVQYVQAHYSTQGEFGLNRSIHTQIAGWRARALTTLAELANERMVPLRFNSDSLLDQNRKPRKAFREDIERVAARLQLNVVKDGYGLRLERKH